MKGWPTFLEHQNNPSVPLHLVVAEEADVVEPAESDTVLRPQEHLPVLRVHNAGQAVATALANCDARLHISNSPYQFSQVKTILYAFLVTQ